MSTIICEPQSPSFRFEQRKTNIISNTHSISPHFPHRWWYRLFIYYFYWQLLAFQRSFTLRNVPVNQSSKEVHHQPYPWTRIVVIFVFKTFQYNFLHPVFTPSNVILYWSFYTDRWKKFSTEEEFKTNIFISQQNLFLVFF